MWYRSIYYFSIISLLSLNPLKCERIKREQRSHTSKDLTAEQIVKLSNLSNTTQLRTLLDNIAVVRVSGTKEHAKVKNYIVDQLEELGWNVERHAFQDNVPIFGKTNFENIIGRLNPLAERFLVLACHYDSKYFAEGNFIGATDSAVPCAMMLNLIYVMRNELDNIKQRSDLSLELIFFDGEEAFRQWSPTDSIYGARKLAQKRQKSLARFRSNNDVNEIEQMDLLVLLDLIGTPDPHFYSYFSATENWYLDMLEAEEDLSELKLFKGYSNGQPEQTYFRPRSMHANIEDDHLPFLKLGVPVLHIIPTPFPSVWHTQADNMKAIDMNTVENLNKIFRVFTAKYLHIPV